MASCGEPVENASQNNDKAKLAPTLATEEEDHERGDKDLGDSDSADVVYKLRDLNNKMVDAWKTAFGEYLDTKVEASMGDIFKGAPAADAIVSPANSFGFMDGGIDMAYSRHFGWQMQHRLQEVIANDHDGELLVGDAIIIPAYDDQISETELEMLKETNSNQGHPIKYLISAPTMRVPMDVSTTVNAYLAFRAVILAVQKHNKRTDVEPIRSVLCPGLGTAVGMMPKERCALQMLEAYKRFELCKKRRMPQNLYNMVIDQEDLCEA